MNGTYEGRPQRTQVGGYVEVPDPHGLASGRRGLTVHAFVWPTRPRRGAIVSRWSARDEAGWALALEDGYPVLTVADGAGGRARIASERRLFAEMWYSIAASFDPEAGTLFIAQRIRRSRVNGRLGNVVPLDLDSFVAATGAVAPADAGVPIVIAGVAEAPGEDRVWVGNCFDGKIDTPELYDRAIGAEELRSLHDGDGVPSGRPLARWDFAAEIGPAGVPSDEVTDVAGGGLHGRCQNQPDRAMTGWNWDGHEEHFVHCPERYGAIWFHADALDDARWEDPVELAVPADLRSGAYALRVSCGEHEDHIPFVVTPPPGRPTAGILLVLPTLSYLAYANSQAMQSAPTAQAVMGVFASLEDRDLELAARPGEYGLSTYDNHADGRGVQYSSWRRPILSVRPRYRHEYGAMWQFPADLHLIDWLEEKGFAFDVVTDHDVQREGAGLLRRYNAVVTGTHPEYVSAAMLDAWEDFLAGGGRGMYLAANGFYWVTSVHPEKPWLIEVRKGETGTQAWRARPGEYHHGFTGERGGLWRQRARAPQKLFGTGMSSHGLDVSTGYVQLPDARDPRVAWILDGVGENEVIGDFGLVNDGAAGLEMDIVDPALGTPPHTMLLASSHGHSANAVLVPEEQFFPHAGMNGVEHPRVRADLVYFTTAGGGAVFSASSMTWCGSLSHDGYDNNVSRITENVLRRFASDEPLDEVV